MKSLATRYTGSARGMSAVLLACLFAGAITLSAQPLAPVKASEDRATLENPEAGWGADYKNWVEFSAGGFFVDENKASFQQRQQLPATAFGGIESFHLEQKLGSNGVFTVEGRALFDNQDYDIKLDYTVENLGYLRGGYREYRTWYDVHGGFYSPGDIWLTPFDREAGVDRGSIWFEAGLRRPNAPEFTLRYEHQFRDGSKDSTLWGDYTVSPGQVRSLVPSLLMIDETRDIFAIDMKHTVKKTDFGVGVRFENGNQDNQTRIVRQPGSLTSERDVTQKDGMSTDMLNAHAYTETRFSEKVMLTSGFAFTTLDTDLSGSRIYGSDFEAVYDPLFARRQFQDAGFLNLSGGSQLNQYLFNLNLMTIPFNNFVIVPALRVEAQNQDSMSMYTATSVGPPPGLRPVTADMQANSQYDFVDVGESLELRYTGLTNWAFYGRGEWVQGSGNINERQTDLDTDFENQIQDTDSDRLTQKYSVGANWYPMRKLNFGLQYYYKTRDITRDPEVYRGGYPGFLRDQSFQTDDVNFRVTWRPLPTLSTVTRYDFQLSTVDTTGTGLSSVQSAESISHIIGESISWTPFTRLYLQANFNYVIDWTETPADVPMGDTGNPLRGLVLKSQNNYFNGSFIAGYALDEKTDLQLQYFYYRADNYVNNGAYSMPYGAGAEENGVTATLIRQLSKSLRWTLKYGFFCNRDETYGGHTDYNAQLVYSSLQYRF